MRRIRIENVKDLIHVVVALKANNSFLVEKNLYEALESEATTCNEMTMNFTIQYGEVPIETIVKFEVFCKAFYRLESVTVNNDWTYKYSLTRGRKEQIIIEAD